MFRQLVSEILLFALPLLVLLLHTIAASAVTSHPVILYSEEIVVSQFYELLKGIAHASENEQISQIQAFLGKHPRFEPAHHKLIERYLKHDRLDDALRYSSDLMQQAQHRNLANWMLAKILRFRHDFDGAWNHYQHAIQADSLSSSLVSDFLQFAYQRSPDFDCMSFIRDLDLGAKERLLFHALSSFENKRYAEAFREFSEISEEYRGDLWFSHLFGQCYYLRSDYSKCDSLWQLGLALARQKGDLQFEAQFLANMGNSQFKARDYSKAGDYYALAQRIARSIDDIYLTQICAGKLGDLSYTKGDYASAAPHYQEAIDLALTIRDNRSLTNWRKNYAQVLYERGNLAEAFSEIEESERLARSINYQSVLPDILIRKGSYYSFLNERDYARIIFQQAYDMASELKLVQHKFRAKFLLANLLVDVEKYDEARTSFLEYAEYLNSKGGQLERAYCFGRIAATYMLEKRFDLAKSAYLQAIETARKARSTTYTAWYLLKVADIAVIEGDLNEAILKYDQVLKTAKEEKNDNMLWWVYIGLGDVHRKGGALPRAIREYSKAANIIEKSRGSLSVEQLRIGYFSDRNNVYDKMAQCFLERYEQKHEKSDLDSLFYFSELRRGRALRERLHRFRSHNYSEDYVKACTDLRKLQRKIRQSSMSFNDGGNLDELLKEREQLQYLLLTQRMKLTLNDSYTRDYDLNEIQSFSEILKNLQQSGFGLLHYHISEDHSFVLTAVEETTKVVPLQVDPVLIDSLITSLLGAMHRVDNNSLKSTVFRADLAYELYTYLIKPVEDALALPQNLMIVPDTPLMNLPFEMLLNAQPETREYSPTDAPTYAQYFLANRYVIVYSPITYVAERTSQPKIDETRIAVFADPFAELLLNEGESEQLNLRTGWRFEPLVYSNIEAERIKELNPEQTKIFVRREATKETFLEEARKHQVIHFAGHAFADTTFDAFSGLVFAVGEDSTDDGLLMGYEISDLQLNCDLVALSACETGRGRIVEGEGVLGLPRLFLAAGAKTVLMTHWKVADRFASQFMPEFYRYYLKHGLSKAEALTQAKRKILAEISETNDFFYQHPFYWAAFTLYGDPGMQSRRQSGIPYFGILIMIALLGGVASLHFFMKFKHKLKKINRNMSS